MVNKMTIIFYHLILEIQKRPGL